MNIPIKMFTLTLLERVLLYLFYLQINLEFLEIISKDPIFLSLNEKFVAVKFISSLIPAEWISHVILQYAKILIFMSSQAFQ